jgi:hypothetical protein
MMIWALGIPPNGAAYLCGNPRRNGSSMNSFYDDHNKNKIVNICFPHQYPLGFENKLRRYSA